MINYNSPAILQHIPLTFEWWRLRHREKLDEGATSRDVKARRTCKIKIQLWALINPSRINNVKLSCTTCVKANITRVDCETAEWIIKTPCWVSGVRARRFVSSWDAWARPSFKFVTIYGPLPLLLRVIDRATCYVYARLPTLCLLRSPDRYRKLGSTVDDIVLLPGRNGIAPYGVGFIGGASV